MNPLEKEFEAEDPLELVGVQYATEATEESDLEMARVLAEEFALTGFSAFEVAKLFESPFYAAPHGILQRRGPEFVRAAIEGVYRGQS